MAPEVLELEQAQGMEAPQLAPPALAMAQEALGLEPLAQAMEGAECNT